MVFGYLFFICDVAMPIMRGGTKFEQYAVTCLASGGKVVATMGLHMLFVNTLPRIPVKNVDPMMCFLEILIMFYCRFLAAAQPTWWQTFTPSFASSCIELGAVAYGVRKLAADVAATEKRAKALRDT